MPSQTRSSSRIRSSAAKKIQKRFRSRKIKIQRQRSKATRKIQSIARAKIQGKQTRKLINRVKTTMLTDNNCPVCLEPMTSTEKIATLLPCGHRFHTKCIKASLPTTRGECPLCRNGVVNIPYVQPGRANRTFGNIPLSQQQPPPPPQSLILDLTQRRQYTLDHLQELEAIEQGIREQRLQLPDPPTIPALTFNEVPTMNYDQALEARALARAARLRAYDEYIEAGTNELDYREMYGADNSETYNTLLANYERASNSYNLARARLEEIMRIINQLS